MVIGTTATRKLKIPGADLTEATEILVTITQGKVRIDIEDAEIVTATAAGTELSFNLTETDALKLSPGPAKIQVNWLFDDGGTARREATKAKMIPALEQLYPEKLIEEANNG